MDDRRLMLRALRLAARAEGRTAPNPLVGSVVTAGGELVGEGWHHRAGEPHAEVLALRAAGARAAGGTLYVTLEPCCHHGRTPPCTEAILGAGIRRVVAAMEDPFDRVRGEGIHRLRAAGVQVEVGLCEPEARELNRAYLKVMATGLPWCTLKMAATLDGRAADRHGSSRWVTGEPARREVHRMRDRHDAVLVGLGTARRDDPQLTARLRGARNPVRVVVDPRAELPPSSRLVRTAVSVPTLIAVGEAADTAELESAGVLVERVPIQGGRADLEFLFRRLKERSIHSLLCEGGPRMAGSLLELGLVDRVAWFVASRLLVDGEALPALVGSRERRIQDTLKLTRVRLRAMGEDFLMVGDVHRDH